MFVSVPSFPQEKLQLSSVENTENFYHRQAGNAISEKQILLQAHQNCQYQVLQRKKKKNLL